MNRSGERVLDAAYARHRRTHAAVVVMTVLTAVVIFVALVACTEAGRGTVTKRTTLPDGTYQLEVVDDPGTSNRDRTYELVDAGRSTGCDVGEVYPTCD